MDWTEFDSMVDEKMLQDIRDRENGKEPEKKEFTPLPFGKYEVVPEKFEFKPTKKGKPMTVAWLRVVAGAHKGAILFANFVMASEFGIFKVKDFIRKLEPSSSVEFTSFSQWNVYLKGIEEEICCKASYVIEYGQDVAKNGTFAKYTVIDGAFEVPDDYTPPQPKNNNWQEQ